MQNKVLKSALFSFVEAGPNKINFDKPELASWVESSARQFAAAWSQDYFDWLWRTVDHPDQEAARLEWLHALTDKAVAVLDSAMERAPQRNGRHYRARVRANGLFHGLTYKTFPELKEESDARRTG